MKIHIITFILLLPLLLVFSCGSLIYNIIGIIYCFILFRLAKTRKGRIFVKLLENEHKLLTDKMFKL